MRDQGNGKSITQLIKDAITRDLPPFMIEQKQEIIDSGGTKNGRSWKPLAAQTVQRKKREGKPFPNAPLKGWGDLYNDFTADKTGQTTNSMTFTLDNTAEGNDGYDWMPSTKYAELQDKGYSPNPWGRVTPARPFLDYNDEDLEEITKQIVVIITKALS